MSGCQWKLNFYVDTWCWENLDEEFPHLMQQQKQNAPLDPFPLVAGRSAQIVVFVQTKEIEDTRIII